MSFCNCENVVEDGEIQSGFTAGERTLTGNFKIDTDESTIVMNMRDSWEELNNTKPQLAKLLES
jgi:hypothetical protein